MLASVQARAQLSKCSLSGSAQGELKMELSSLKDVITAHSSGMTTMNAHRTSIPWEKTLRTLPSFFCFRGLVAGTSTLPTEAPDSAGTEAGVSVVFIGVPPWTPWPSDRGETYSRGAGQGQPDRRQDDAASLLHLRQLA